MRKVARRPVGKIKLSSESSLEDKLTSFFVSSFIRQTFGDNKVNLADMHDSPEILLYVISFYCLGKVLSSFLIVSLQ